MHSVKGRAANAVPPCQYPGFTPDFESVVFNNSPGRAHRPERQPPSRVLQVFQLKPCLPLALPVRAKMTCPGAAEAGAGGGHALRMAAERLTPEDVDRSPFGEEAPTR
jgi:hypothetical protein